MNKKKISKLYIEAIWLSLYGDPISDENFLSSLNLNNLDDIKKLVAMVLFPEYQSYPESWQYRFKQSYKYAIAYMSDDELDKMYNATYPCINYPRSMSLREFYICVWQYLFNDESYEAEEKENYQLLSSDELYAYRARFPSREC